MTITQLGLLARMVEVTSARNPCYRIPLAFHFGFTRDKERRPRRAACCADNFSRRSASRICVAEPFLGGENQQGESLAEQIFVRVSRFALQLQG